MIINVLTNADHRGLAIPIVLDPRERPTTSSPLGDLSATVRIKRGGPYMHLKVDGQVLRTGSANFSITGECRQDNDLVVIRDSGAAAKFDAHFESRLISLDGLTRSLSE